MGGLFMKGEDLEECLRDCCAKCKCPASLFEEWFGETLYRTGHCGGCGYKNHVFVRKA